MTENNSIPQQSSEINPFKIDGTDVASRNIYFVEGGIHKVKLAKVVAQETTTQKGTFLTLEFTVTDLEGIKNHVDKIFAPKNDEKFNNAMARISDHVKHIWKQFLPIPQEGIVSNATDVKDLFNKIATAFNTGNNGNPIYAEKHALYWKMIFNNGSRFLSTPLFPDFCERINEKNKDKPKYVQILGNDKIELPKAPAQSAPSFMGNQGTDVDVPF